MSDQSNNDLAALFPELQGILGAMDQPPAAPAPLATDPEHGGVTDDQINQFFQNNPGIRSLPPLVSNQQANGTQFRSGSTGQPPVGGVEGPEGQPPPGATFGQQPAPAAPEGFQAPPPAAPAPGAPPAAPATPTQQQPAPTTIDPQVELDQLRALQAQIKADPQLRAKIADHFVGRAAPEAPQPPNVPAPPLAYPQQDPQPFQFQPPQNPPQWAPPTGPAITQPRAEPIVPQPPQFFSQPPANLDMEDPSIAALWGIVQTQQQQLQATAGQVQQNAAAANDRMRQDFEAAYVSARDGFKGRYELNDQDIAHLDGVATRLGVLPQLLSGVDPLTGIPIRTDPLSAMDRAFEIAYFVDPTYRQREWERQAIQRRTDAQRQQRLQAVAGSPASVPRTTPAPTTQQGRDQAMLAEVGQMLNGSWTDPAAN